MKLVAPDYLSYSTLPLASDIFYHGKITYSLPTGFTPEELNAVYEFPEYCLKKQLPQPEIIWEYCHSYFLNSQEAFECMQILAPIKELISINQFVYGRNIAQINKSLAAISANTQLFKDFQAAYNNIPFISREFLSHLLFEVVLECGFGGACDYLNQFLITPDSFFQLVAATLVNRIRSFKNSNVTFLVYNHEWVPLLLSCGTFDSSKSDV